VNITSEKLQRLIEQEVRNSFLTNDDEEETTMELEENDKLVLTGAVNAIKSRAEASEDADEVEWYLSKVVELFGMG